MTVTATACSTAGADNQRRQKNRSWEVRTKRPRSENLPRVVCACACVCECVYMAEAKLHEGDDVSAEAKSES
eukprot:7870263-Pyramimonas_sp.AAC.1